MTTMNISLPDEMKAFVEAQLEADGYASASEYLRALIREDQKRRAKQELEAKFREALESGPATPMTKEDWAALRQEAEEFRMLDRRSFLGRFGASLVAGISLLRTQFVRAGDHVGGEMVAPTKQLSIVPTPEMVVTVQFLANDDVVFTGKTMDFKLSIHPNPRKKGLKSDLPAFTAKNLAELPAGEFSVDGVSLLDSGGDYRVYLEFEALSLPGVTTQAEDYHLLVDKARKPDSGIKSHILVRVDGGPSFRIKHVANISSSRVKVSPKLGLAWGGTRIIAQSAIRVD